MYYVVVYVMLLCVDLVVVVLVVIDQGWFQVVQVIVGSCDQCQLFVMDLVWCDWQGDIDQVMVQCGCGIGYYVVFEQYFECFVVVFVCDVIGIYFKYFEQMCIEWFVLFVDELGVVVQYCQGWVVFECCCKFGYFVWMLYIVLIVQEYDVVLVVVQGVFEVVYVVLVCCMLMQVDLDVEFVQCFCFLLQV